MLLRAGDVTVDVQPEAGGRLAQIEVAGRRLLRGLDDSTGEWHAWGCYPMVPWCNRVPGGRLVFEEQEYELPATFRDGSAIHGLGAQADWAVVEEEQDAGVLEAHLEHAPFVMSCRQTIRLHPDRVDVALTLVNQADHRAPAGLGIHPWFAAAPLEVPASMIWPSVDQIPVRPARPVRPAEDLTSLREPPVLDHCFTGLTAMEASIGDLVLSWSPEISHVVVYTGTPGWVSVEPMTHATDGFGMLERGWTGHGVVVLEPGQQLAASLALSWSRADVSGG